MGQTTIQRAFSGGELAPALAARADEAKYQTGLRTCRNFLILRHGGVANRPGFRYVATTKTSATDTFLLRYVSAVAGASCLIEAGPHYLRFYHNGALVRLTGVVAYDGAIFNNPGDIVSSGGVNYYAIKRNTATAPPNATYWYAMPDDILELPTPFGNAGFAWVQSGTTITMTSQLVAPYELINLVDGTLVSWVIRQVPTVPMIGPPTGILITPGAAGTLSYTYIVTSRDDATGEESGPSAIAQVTNILAPTPTAPNVLTWTAPVDIGLLPGGAIPTTYDVYVDPFGNGVFGYLGTTTGGVTFNDVGDDPDFTRTPPIPRVMFKDAFGANDYPATAGYYQQRRFFANTPSVSDGVWGSRIGLVSNFNISSPLQDDDAITFRMAGNQHNPVRHLIGLRALVVLTGGGEWTVAGAPTLNGPVNVPLSPNSIDAQQQGYAGVSTIRHVIVGDKILYVQARQTILRDLGFDQAQAGGTAGLSGKDLTLFAAHLFDGFTIDRVDFQQTPHSIIWTIRSDGTLLGLSYIPEQDVWGWSRHDTGAGGLFEDVCVVPEFTEDALYVLVRRTIGGAFVRYIERLAPRLIVDFNADSFFLDAGLTYTGPPTVTTIAGLDHLEGQVVAVVCDGVVVFNGDPASLQAPSFTVLGGTIAAVLPASTIVHAGLPIRFAEIETLDLDVAGAAVRDKKKRVGSVSLLLEHSVRTFSAGPDSTRLVPHKLKPYEVGQAGVSYTGQQEITIPASYNDYGHVFIRQTDPLPLTVLGLMPNVELGG